MRISAAQIILERGNLEENIRRHLKIIDLAVLRGCEMIVFPELSLTGYETERARDLALTEKDSKLNVFQETSDLFKISITVGAPLKNNGSVSIAALTFTPQANKPMIYNKMFLHADEEAYFTSGSTNNNILPQDSQVALAICYELSVSAHIEKALEDGATIYLASVAKTDQGVKKAHSQLSQIASDNSIYALMANSIGPSSDGMCLGQSAIWDQEGKLIDQLDDHRSGILILDTETGRTNAYYLV